MPRFSLLLAAAVLVAPLPALADGGADLGRVPAENVAAIADAAELVALQASRAPVILDVLPPIDLRVPAIEPAFTAFSPAPVSVSAGTDWALIGGLAATGAAVCIAFCSSGGADGIVPIAGPGGVPGAPVGEVPAIPEPSAWAMMLLGFGSIGAMLRRRVQGRVMA